MDQRALEHPGDDLHVLVRMCLEARSWRDYVVIVDQEQPMMGIQRVVVAGKRERVLGVQPSQPGLEPIAPRRTSTVGASASVVSVIVAPPGRPGSRRDDGRDHRDVQLRAVLVSDLGADLGGLLADGAADVSGAERHDHLVPDILHDNLRDSIRAPGTAPAADRRRSRPTTRWYARRTASGQRPSRQIPGSGPGLLDGDLRGRVGFQPLVWIGRPLSVESPNVPSSSRCRARSSAARRSRKSAAMESSMPSADSGWARSAMSPVSFSASRSCSPAASVPPSRP